jgi:hypothetical protein
MINEIDHKLNEINIENQFSDTNMVTSSIEKITKKEKTKFYYIYRCFLILFLILFSLRVCNESLLVICPYYFRENNISLEVICIFMAATLLVGNNII